MRLLYFIDGLRAGGKERRFLELVQSLNDDTIDYRIVIIHPEVGFWVPPAIMAKTVQIQKRGKRDLHVFIKFFNICREYKPDLIHTWSNMVTFYALPAKILLNKKMVNSQVSDAPPNFIKWSFFAIICRINFAFSNLILCNSEAGQRVYGAPARKTKIIYNGVNLARFLCHYTKEQIKKELGITTKYCIVMVENFSETKDYHSFIMIASRCAKLRTDITSSAAGEGKSLDYFISQATEMCLARCLFLGCCKDIERILITADVGLLISSLSHGEGISNSILEYMAMSLPVIANNSGGTREVIVDGFNGYLLQSDIVENATVKIIDLIINRTMAIRMGQNGRHLIENRFNIDVMKAAFLQVYYELCKNRIENS